MVSSPLLLWFWKKEVIITWKFPFSLVSCHHKLSPVIAFFHYADLSGQVSCRLYAEQHWQWWAWSRPAHVISGQTALSVVWRTWHSTTVSGDPSTEWQKGSTTQWGSHSADQTLITSLAWGRLCMIFQSQYFKLSFGSDGTDLWPCLFNHRWEMVST